MPSIVPEGRTRGWIIPIGGAENKENDRHILERFVRVSGGSDADIVVIPTASRLHETGPRYEKLFRDIGAARVTVMDFDTRRDCHEPGRLQRLEQASGVFFTGGNQLRLTTLLGGTPVAKMIRTSNAQGVTVGGTSAGASILSEHMIAFGDEGSSVISGSVRLAPGLGLTNRFIIDQHFRQRDRLGRLLTALAYNPFAVGIGLDEDTAAFIGPGRNGRGRGQRRRHGRRCVGSELLVHGRGQRGPAGLHARAQDAHPRGGCDVQPAHAAGLGRDRSFSRRNSSPRMLARARISRRGQFPFRVSWPGRRKSVPGGSARNVVLRDGPARTPGTGTPRASSLLAAQRTAGAQRLALAPQRLRGAAQRNARAAGSSSAGGLLAGPCAAWTPRHGAPTDGFTASRPADPQPMANRPPER